MRLLTEAAKAGSLEAQGELAEALADGLQGTKPDAARAVAVAKKPAQAGNPFALDTLGGCFRNGLGGLPKDEEKARACFLRAFEGFKRMSEEPNPDVRALCYLGCYLGDGRGAADGKPNESPEVAAETTRLWRRSAEIGFATAACNVAFAYLNGDGVAEDEAEGVRWLRAAANLGHWRAISELGQCYFYGTCGVERNVEKGLKALRQIATAGGVWEARLLGNFYLLGTDGVEKNEAEGIRWYRLAADRGDEEAPLRIAVCCERGIGVEQSDVEAVRWARVALERGSADGALWLGRAFEEGRLGLAQDEAEAERLYRKALELGSASAAWLFAEKAVARKDGASALSWFRKSAELGDAEAAVVVGDAYIDGNASFGGAVDYRIEADPAEAARWYRKAAEAGNETAIERLAHLLREGLGVEKDEAAAVALYRKAAEAGDAVAAFNLGSHLLDGVGCEKDEAEGARWIRIAAEAGDPDALYVLGALAETGKLGGKEDAAEAARWYRKAAEAGNRDAMERLARCYLRGDGVEQNPNEATRWLLRSGALGESDDICARAIMLDSEGKVQVVNFIEPDYRGFFGFFRRIFDAITGIFRR